MPFENVCKSLKYHNMKNDKFIITINREFGTGGREIAQKLGNLLDVKVYDKALLDALAQKFNMTEEEIELAKSKQKNWWSDFVNFYKQFGNSDKVDHKERVTSKEIYAAEEKILKGIAEKESCIIVGRAGFSIFKDYPNSVKILLIADDEARVKRIAEKEDMSVTEARKVVKQIDGERDKYITTFAGVSRYDARNYNFVLDVTGIPTHLVAVFIAQNIRLRFPNIFKS